MASKRRLALAVLPALALSLFALAYAAEKAEKDEKEEAVDYKTLPEPVRKAAEAFFGTAEGLKAEKATDEGVTSYEVAGLKGGLRNEVKLTGTGELMAIERQSSFEKLPAAAQAALKKDYPGSKFTKVEAVEAHFYEVKVQGAKGTTEVKVFATGDIEDGERGDAADDDKDGK